MIPTLIHKIRNSVRTYAHVHDTFNLQGMVADPAVVCLILDSDDNQSGGIGNNPDASDSHGSLGGNGVFCDGHAELVRQRKCVYRFELSEDNDRTKP
jgi:prepilin-type processing-associated H-X9-DG protein